MATKARPPRGGEMLWRSYERLVGPKIEVVWEQFIAVHVDGMSALAPAIDGKGTVWLNEQQWEYEKPESE